MRKVSNSEKETIEQYFETSIYTSAHMGWMDCWEINGSLGTVWLDDEAGNNNLIAFQKINPETCWLHSFYASKAPNDYPLIQKLRMLLPTGLQSVYSISSQNWYTKFLQENGFRIADEIVQMETTSIRPFSVTQAAKVHPLTPDYAHSLCSICESAFPPLWRLETKEMQKALEIANYSRAVFSNGEIAGYILAEFEDGNCHIDRLAISPAYQHAGFGSQLLNLLISDSRQQGIQSFSVNTNRKNSDAIDFYKKYNFHLIEEKFPVFHRYIHANGKMSIQ